MADTSASAKAAAQTNFSPSTRFGLIIFSSSPHHSTSQERRVKCLFKVLGICRNSARGTVVKRGLEECPRHKDIRHGVLDSREGFIVLVGIRVVVRPPLFGLSDLHPEEGFGVKDLFGARLHLRTHGPLANASVVEVGYGSPGGQDGQRGLR
jgi:hypothetical protein